MITQLEKHGVLKKFIDSAKNMIRYGCMRFIPMDRNWIPLIETLVKLADPKEIVLNLIKENPSLLSNSPETMMDALILILKQHPKHEMILNLGSKMKVDQFIQISDPQIQKVCIELKKIAHAHQRRRNAIAMIQSFLDLYPYSSIEFLNAGKTICRAHNIFLDYENKIIRQSKCFSI